MIFAWLKRRRRRALLAAPLPSTWLTHLEANLEHWDYLTDAERSRLLDISRVLVAEKDWEGCGGLEMTEEVQVTIAAQAALLLLGLEHDHYPNVHSVLVYPTGYRLPRQGDLDFVEPDHVPVLGHASMHGPVVLSWRSARSGGRDARDGRNLVFHEFAHKLDMLDGAVDGTPLLRDRRAYRRWFAVMTREYERLQAQARRGRKQVIDLYGATNVAEFFAVITEAFFEHPRRLERLHAALYATLRDFYGQDPAARLARRPRRG